MYTPETFSFFIQLLNNMRISAAILQEPYTNSSDFDFGMRRMAYPDMDIQAYARSFCTSRQPNIIYKTFDEFLFQYLILLLPDGSDQKRCLVIGPYTLHPFQETDILNKAQEFCIPPEQYAAFKNCYASVPLISDSSMFMTIVNTFGAELWGSLEHFSLVELTGFEAAGNPADRSVPSFETSEELFLLMKRSEEKYAAENELFQMISHGQLHKVEMYFDLIDFRSAEQRLADPVRNAKNYAIILNTLLRKAAEEGAVHPFHIDRISSEFARKIELQTSEQGISALFKEMVRKYVLLVKNRSMKGYSRLIRRVMIHVDSSLSSDLSLHTQAALLGVNPNYLSTIFKKETGHTLTEYVTGKRIEHAVFLLNSTNMQIQTIAQYCGILDICYFTKLFKKHVGKTPSEYRKGIMS